jgi:hypothetical protein
MRAALEFLEVALTAVIAHMIQALPGTVETLPVFYVSKSKKSRRKRGHSREIVLFLSEKEQKAPCADPPG